LDAVKTDVATFMLALLSPVAVLVSQWITRDGQAKLQRVEHKEGWRVREREFEEQRRARVHDARVQAHAEMVRLIDALKTPQRSGEQEDEYEDRVRTSFDGALSQAATVSVYSSPVVANLAQELVWHMYHHVLARQHGYVQVGNPEDPEAPVDLSPSDAWRLARDGRAEYIAAFQTELGIVT
jgi:hypothetical protein